MNVRTRISLVSAGALVVAIAGTTGAGSSDSQDTHEPASERRVLHGLLEPSETATVGMLAEGILLANSAKEGDVVHEGDVIAMLESAVESVALRMSEIQGASTQQIRLAQKRLELAQIEFKRFTDLIRKNAAAEHELVTARLQAEAAEINVAIAMENHELARLRAERDRALFERRILRSPIDGQVIKRHRQPGELVHNLNPLVFDIAKLDPIRVRVDCPGDLIHETSVGDRALIYAPRLPKEGLAARITFVSPVLDAASDTFLIHIEVPNTEGKLVAGTRLSVELVR